MDGGYQKAHHRSMHLSTVPYIRFGVQEQATHRSPPPPPREVVETWRVASKRSRWELPVKKRPRCGIQKSPRRTCSDRGPVSPKSRPQTFAWLDSITHVRFGLARNLWPLGTAPTRFMRPAPRTRLPALPTARSSTSLRHNASGRQPAAVFMRSDILVRRRHTCQ